MADLLEKLQAIIKPSVDELLDTGWLDALPRNDYLAALDTAVIRLRAFAADENPYDHAALGALRAIDIRCRENVSALSKQYVAAPVLAHEVDERLWQSVYNYHHVLERAYQAFLERHGSALAASPIASDLPQLLLNIVDCQRCMAKWRYLRYQSMMEGGWLKLHRLYQMAERLDCASTPLRRYPDQSETTLLSSYMQALMLDTLNHTSMLKGEIELVADYLADWCGTLLAEADYDEKRHLFFTCLDEDRGGRRIRHFQPSPQNRYWEVDSVVRLVEQLQLDASRSGMLPVMLSHGVSAEDMQLMTEHMLGEWSRSFYLRQRRTDEREAVVKVATVMNGILNVCQHVKNVIYSRGRVVQNDGIEASSPATAETPAATEQDGAMVLGFGAERWLIQNESKFGFGAEVHSESNLWLRPGKLIALDYELNPDMPVVGVVRSVKQRPEGMRHVGIEVLCHTPSYVRLRSLPHDAREEGFLPGDVFLATALSTHGPAPFPALYLTKDEERDVPPTLLLPRVEFIAGGVFELRTDQHHSQVRLGRVIEQKDDWVRVEMHLPEPGAAAA